MEKHRRTLEAFYPNQVLDKPHLIQDLSDYKTLDQLYKQVTFTIAPRIPENPNALYEFVYTNFFFHVGTNNDVFYLEAYQDLLKLQSPYDILQDQNAGSKDIPISPENIRIIIAIYDRIIDFYKKPANKLDTQTTPAPETPTTASLPFSDSSASTAHASPTPSAHSHRDRSLTPPPAKRLKLGEEPYTTVEINELTRKPSRIIKFNKLTIIPLETIELP